MGEQRVAGVERIEDDLGHAVVDFPAQGGELVGGEDGEGFAEGGVVELNGELDHALDALHGG